MPVTFSPGYLGHWELEASALRACLRRGGPRYIDRVHIGAVLTPCDRVRAEALRKTAALREID